MIEKKRSLEVSENVINLLTEKHNNNLEGYIDTFNNHRETGFVLKLDSINNMKFKEQFVVWMHQDRMSDNIVIRYADTWEDCDINNMFSDNVYEGQSMFFPCNDYEDSVKYIIDMAEKTAKLEQEKEYKFERGKDKITDSIVKPNDEPIEDLQKENEPICKKLSTEK